MLSIKFVYRIGIFGMILATGCQNHNKVIHQNGTDLMKYGIPVNVVLPENSEITKGKTGRTSDVYIKNNSGYNLHISMSEASSANVTNVVKEKKRDIVTNPDFLKIVEEYSDGLYYEKYGTDGSKGYDFFLVQIIGQQEVIFQGGLAVNFSEDEVKKMIKSIRKN
jgi:hypothetical protein